MHDEFREPHVHHSNQISSFRSQEHRKLVNHCLNTMVTYTEERGEPYTFKMKASIVEPSVALTRKRKIHRSRTQGMEARTFGMKVSSAELSLNYRSRPQGRERHIGRVHTEAKGVAGDHGTVLTDSDSKGS
jgi:hypothetical protein